MATWERVTLQNKTGTTFVKFCLGHTGKQFSVKRYRGFGIQQEDSAKPSIFVSGKIRYFKTEESRDRYLARQREFWGVQ